MSGGTTSAGVARVAGRLTADLIYSSPQYMNCVDEYELDLRGEGPPSLARVQCKALTLLPSWFSLISFFVSLRHVRDDLFTKDEEENTRAKPRRKPRRGKGCDVTPGGCGAGNKLAAVENLAVTKDVFDSIDLSDNDVVRLEGFPKLPKLKTLLLNNNRVTRLDKDFGCTAHL